MWSVGIFCKHGRDTSKFEVGRGTLVSRFKVRKSHGAVLKGLLMDAIWRYFKVKLYYKYYIVLEEEINLSLCCLN